jgi:hypothetical protein
MVSLFRMLVSLFRLSLELNFAQGSSRLSYRDFLEPSLGAPAAYAGLITCCMIIGFPVKPE